MASAAKTGAEKCAYAEILIETHESTLPETNSSHDGGNTIVSFWGLAYFQVRTVSLREGKTQSYLFSQSWRSLSSTCVPHGKSWPQKKHPRKETRLKRVRSIRFRLTCLFSLANLKSIIFQVVVRHSAIPTNKMVGTPNNKIRGKPDLQINRTREGFYQYQLVYFFATRLKHIRQNGICSANFRSTHSNNLQTTYPHPRHPNTEKVFGSPKNPQNIPIKHPHRRYVLQCMGLRISLWISVVTDWFGDSIQNPPGGPALQAESKHTKIRPKPNGWEEICQFGSFYFDLLVQVVEKNHEHIPTPNGRLMVMNPDG